MFKEQFLLEADFYFRKKLFYVMLVLFIGLGYLMSVVANFSFPGVYVNSPYTLTYAIGLISLINIFTITIFSAQILLREKDSNFAAILYATALNKKHFLFSRFGLIFLITILSYFLFVTGFMIGHIMQGSNEVKFMDFNLINYLYPFLILVLPNTFFCTAIVSTVGWLSKNKMLIYLSGLFIYILYMIVSLFSNSPLLANASPVSAGTMSLMAKLDPFGLAAFFEQTKQWSPSMRNTQLLQLSGNFLFNRIAVIIISYILLFITYMRYRFSLGGKEKRKFLFKNEAVPKEIISYKPVQTINSGNTYNWSSLFSFMKMDIRTIVNSIPFVIVSILWIFFLGMEIYSDIEAGIRLPQRYASSALIVKNIIGTFPFFILAVLLFYGVEMLWRSRNVKIDAMENATSVNSSAVLAAKIIALFVVPLLLIIFSIVFGVVLQYLLQYPVIEWDLYASLFYILGVPSLLSAGIVIAIQAITGKKYLGLVLASLFLLITNSFIGGMLGLQHPLFRFAKSFLANPNDMNGFGAYLEVFGIKMLYWAALTILAGILASYSWAGGKISFLNRLSRMKAITWTVIVICLIALIGFGMLINQNSIVESKYAKADRQQDYEQSYRRYQNVQQPTIASVQTTIDLFPVKNSYSIKGNYVLTNRNTVALDSLLLYCRRSVTLKDVVIENAELISADNMHGHYRYRLLKPLQPGDSINMSFAIDYNWTAYNQHDPFNAIIENGSFMRISRYYPIFGYQEGNEMDDEDERKKRNLGSVTPLKKLEDSSAYDYSFINFDAVISTDGQQTAIGTGELIKKWVAGGRNFFHYKSPAPIPFRFAVSSARYAVKTASQNNIVIEVYYHPSHSENVQQLLEEAKNTISYCEKNFGKYPFNAIRFAEVSDFTEGFAATSYPGAVFMTESNVFHADIRKNEELDVINALAGHELSHEWWGNSQIAPETKEGSALLRETLAQYTELMLYKNRHGIEAMKRVVDMNQSVYDNAKVYAGTEPLYKVHEGNVFLAYNKGMVAMYKLYSLIGEEKMNLALKNFVSQYAFPNKPPTTIDLINEFLKVSDKSVHEKIREIFM